MTRLEDVVVDDIAFDLGPSCSRFVQDTGMDVCWSGSARTSNLPGITECSGAGRNIQYRSEEIVGLVVVEVAAHSTRIAYIKRILGSRYFARC